MHKFYLSISVLALSFVPVLNAQDSRIVKEPVYPPACATLTAQLSYSGNAIAPSDEPERDKESPLDTDRIQAAIDKCAKGHAVVLRAQGVNDSFLSGPLQLRDGVTLIVAKDTTLWGSRNPAVYENAPGSCGIVVRPDPAHPMNSPHAPGCKPLILADHVKGAGIMGDGVIDGRGGDRMVGQDKSWWDLAEMTRPGYGHQVTHLITARDVQDFTLYRITLKNSGNVHVSFNGDGLTAWGVIIDTPKRHSRNSDGIDPGGKNITITHSYIRAGDDNVALEGGGSGITNVTVSHDHFYWGHGLSIGSGTSGGVSKIRAFDVSLDGADNGIRIKSNGSRGGLTHDVSYDNICIRNSANPIVLDTAYAANGDIKGPLVPVMKDVTVHNVRVSGGGKFSFNGYDETHRVQTNLNNVLITDDADYKYSVSHADIDLGPGPVNLKLPAGTDSTIQGKPASNGKPLSCDAMFVPFPLHYSAVR